MRSVLVVLLLLQLLQLLRLSAANTDSHAGLSTNFGHNNKNNQADNNNNVPLRGKECTTEANCTAFINTTCMSDPRDSKMRCLCGDRLPPKNGICKNTFRVLRFPCNADSECVENAECVLPSNSTSNMTMSGAALAPNIKVCLCRPGFEEEENLTHCGNGANATTLSLALLLATVVMQLSNV